VIENTEDKNLAAEERIQDTKRFVRQCWLSAQMGQIVNRDFELISRAL